MGPLRLSQKLLQETVREWDGAQAVASEPREALKTLGRELEVEGVGEEEALIARKARRSHDVRALRTDDDEASPAEYKVRYNLRK